MQANRPIKPSPRYAAELWMDCAAAAPRRDTSQPRGHVEAAGLSNEPLSLRYSAGLSPCALQRVLAFVRDHLGDNLSLNDLAAAACISRFHFARQFRQTTGFSPMDFILAARIEAGREMLCRGEQKISSLAVALGFYDQSHFTRTFRRVTGLAPRQFRRALLGRDSRPGEQRRPTAAMRTTESKHELNRSNQRRMRARNAV